MKALKRMLKSIALFLSATMALHGSLSFHLTREQTAASSTLSIEADASATLEHPKAQHRAPASD
jgi:hypothetical protein